MKLTICGDHNWELGGGQKYLEALATALRLQHDVTILPKERGREADIMQSNEHPFGKKLAYVIQIPYSPITPKTIGAKLLHGEIRDARRDIGRKRLLMDAARSEIVLVYSEFVRTALQKHGINATVLYPPVKDYGGSGIPKQKVILSVGRFFKKRIYNHKRYDALIEAFKIFCTYQKGWEYRIVGGMEPNEDAYVRELAFQAGGYNVKFYPNATDKELEKHYAEASLFWHGAGYEARGPEECEHFGISIVEAMSAECIPFVPLGGGPMEILGGYQYPCGHLWDRPEMLAMKSAMTIDPFMRFVVRQRAYNFSIWKFTQRALSIFNHLEER